MPTPTIDYALTPEGTQLTTQGTSFTSPGQSGGGRSWDELFKELSDRKAVQEAEARKLRAADEQRRQEMHMAQLKSMQPVEQNRPAAEELEYTAGDLNPNIGGGLNPLWAESQRRMVAGWMPARQAQLRQSLGLSAVPGGQNRT